MSGKTESNINRGEQTEIKYPGESKTTDWTIATVTIWYVWPGGSIRLDLLYNPL